MLTLAAGGVGIPLYIIGWALHPRRRARAARRRAPAQPPRHLAGGGRNGLPDALRRAHPAQLGAVVRRQDHLAAGRHRGRRRADLAPVPAGRDRTSRRPRSGTRLAARRRQPRRRGGRAGDRRRAAVPQPQRLARARPRRRPARRGRADRVHGHPRALVDPARAGPGARARRAHPQPGARRGRRPPARLRAADARARPEARRRPARGRRARPPAGARAARLAEQHPARPARRRWRARWRPPRRRSRPTTTCRSRS